MLSQIERATTPFFHSPLVRSYPTLKCKVLVSPGLNQIAFEGLPESESSNHPKTPSGCSTKVQGATPSPSFEISNFSTPESEFESRCLTVIFGSFKGTSTIASGEKKASFENGMPLVLVPLIVK